MDSLEYLDIFNSRCPLSKIESYISYCTAFEIDKLRSDNFDAIYQDSFSSHRDYRELLDRWIKIKPFVQRGLDNYEQKTTYMYTLPKGKKKTCEQPETAALREFVEETRIPISKIKKAYYPTYTVTFKGTDDKIYRSIYYVYYCEQFISIEPTWRDNYFQGRNYSISEEMEYLLWIPIDQIDQYLPQDLVNVLRVV
uniref:Nudix hydrolase domain-containing protein n=1 Tax=viral metagenome TaxID=1070528 RepID=A0A6C0JTY1_9ZZZZ